MYIKAALVGPPCSCLQGYLGNGCKPSTDQRTFRRCSPFPLATSIFFFVAQLDCNIEIKNERWVIARNLEEATAKAKRLYPDIAAPKLVQVGNAHGTLAWSRQTDALSTG